MIKMSRKIMPRARKSNEMLSSSASFISNAFEKLNLVEKGNSSLCLKAGASLPLI